MEESHIFDFHSRHYIMVNYGSMTLLKEREASGVNWRDSGNSRHRIKTSVRETQQSTNKHRLTTIMTTPL